MMVGGPSGPKGPATMEPLFIIDRSKRYRYDTRWSVDSGIAHFTSESGASGTSPWRSQGSGKGNARMNRNDTKGPALSKGSIKRYGPSGRSYRHVPTVVCETEYRRKNEIWVHRPPSAQYQRFRKPVAFLPTRNSIYSVLVLDRTNCSPLSGAGGPRICLPTAK